MEIRNINKGLVLRTIEKNDPISRADVGRIVGLTPPTISEREILQVGKSQYY
jgi:hypothetical protein